LLHDYCDELDREKEEDIYNQTAFKEKEKFKKIDESKDWSTSIEDLEGNDEKTFLCLTYFIMSVQQILTLSFTTLLFQNHNKLN